MGSQPSAISAVCSTDLGPSEAIVMGMRGRTGWLMSFSGLPRPVPSPAGSGIVYLAPWCTTGSRRQVMRQISTISRVRASGAS